MGKPKFLNKTPEADLRAQYPKALEMGVVITLAVLSLAFYSMPKFGEGMALDKIADISP